ncbi:MAG: carboxylesterase/lipase family protein [Gemmatimonadaceae bacterium]
MKKSSTLHAFASAVVMLLFATAALSQPLVRIDSGQVAGVAAGDVQTFLGIPYAAPPLGRLRWRAPQPVHPWRGLLKATHYGHDCAQKLFPGDLAPLRTTPAENCLVANVWRPKSAAVGSHLPVLVWIYGGGDVNGGSSPAVYSGASFARDGVIFVSFNYRVGRFGFFAFPALTQENSDKGLLANYGFMDSIAALRWVRRNISAFGGDPQRVTIYGQSAGAGMVKMLLTTPLARGLFARAIIQSGGALPRPDLQIAERAGVNFARQEGIKGDGTEALDRLRALRADKLVDGLNMASSAAQAAIYTGPVRDGRTFPLSLVNAVDLEEEAKVPLIIGSTTADHSNLRTDSLQKAFGEFGVEAARARAVYMRGETGNPQAIIREIGRDIMYGEPDRHIASGMSAQGVPVYQYLFGYVARAMRSQWPAGPPHATDVPYAMKTLQATTYGSQLTPTDIGMAKIVHRYWVNFVRTGNPNGPGLPYWPGYTRHDDAIMKFASDGIPRAVSDPRKARLDVLAAAMRENH